MGGVVDWIEERISDIGEAIESVGSTVINVVEFAVDKIVAPVAKTVTTVIDSALKDPIKTLAQVTAIATQQYWALPLIEGADVAIAGGDFSDIAEATAKAYVYQQVGSFVGEAMGAHAGEFTAAQTYGASLQSGAAGTASQAAMLAAQEAGMGTASAIASAIVGAGAGSAAVAAVSGKDPVEAFLTGGVGVAVPSLLGKVDGFAQLPGAAQRVISAAVTSKLTNADNPTGVINALISGSNIVASILKEVDPGNKMDVTQKAILTDILMGTASSALTGGDASKVVAAAITKAGSQALGDAIKTGNFTSATNKMTNASKDFSFKAQALEDNQTDQEEAANNYNLMAAQLKIRTDRQTELYNEANRLIGIFNQDKTNQANADAANAAIRAANDYTAQLDKDYAEFYKPKLTEYNTTLNSLKQTHAALTGDYKAALEVFTNTADALTTALDPVFATSNRAFVTAMQPDFNADEYRKINNLPEGTDPYEHYLDEGQFKGLPINSEAAKAVLTGDVKGTAIDKPTTAVDPKEVFDGTEYKTIAAAQASAAALGKTYFTGPDGKTYKILSDNETKDKIKTSATFGEAFTLARKTLGADGEFQWTNPETGQTKTYTTKTKEEAASKASAGSLVRVDPQVQDYVTNILTTKLEDHKANPADLTKTEYTRFISAYVNATDVQREQMRNGGDGVTFNIIQQVLDSAPEAVKFLGTTAKAVVAPGDSVTASNYTKYLDTATTGVRVAFTDILQVGVRGLQVFGNLVGADTATLDGIQKLYADQKDEQMSKLVGNERVIAGGLASGIQSAITWTLGGPAGAIGSLGAIAANNAWIEGSNAVIDAKGNSYASEAEAKSMGVYTYRKLTNEENAMRTALMTSLEIAGEAVGLPGLSKVMKGVPLDQGRDAIVASIKRMSAGMLNEQASELATTTAQMAVDKIASFGLNQNATWSDYGQALTDTALATAVAVGSSGSIATALRNMNTAVNAMAQQRTEVTPMSFDTVVAKTSTGQNVTLAELVTANSIADFSNPTANAAFEDLTPTVDLGTLINIGTGNVRLGELFTSAVDVVTATDRLSDSAVAEIFRQNDFVPNDNTVKQFSGLEATRELFGNMAKFIDLNKFDAQEVINTAKKEGVTINLAQAQQYVQQGDEAKLAAALATKLDPTSTTFDEATQFFLDRGYAPSTEEVQAYANSVLGRPTKADAENALKASVKIIPYDTKYDWNGDGKITASDALNIAKAASGNPTATTPSDISGWAMPKPTAETDAQKAIADYVNPRQVTFDEAKKYLTDLGYSPTVDEIKQFVGQVNEAGQAEKIKDYVNPRMVSEQEVKDAYAALGLATPTQADVAKLVGQYAQTELEGKAKANLNVAQYNSVLAKLDEMSEGASKEVLDAVDTVKKDLTAKIVDVGVDIADLSDDLATAKKDITDIVGEFKKGSDARFDKVDAAIKTLTEKGLTEAQVSRIVGDSLTPVTDRIKGVADLVGVPENIPTQADAVAALNMAVRKEYDKKYDWNGDGKITASDALSLAQAAVGQAPPMAEGLPWGQPTGVYKAVLDSQLSLEKALAEVEKGSTKQFDTVNKAIADLAKAGLTVDQVTKIVNTSAEGLSTGFKSALADATKDLATTEGVRTAINTALQGIATTKDLENTQRAVLDKAAEYEAAGIKRDEAITKAVDAVAKDLGAARTDILGKIGAPETVDAQGNKVAATGVYAALDTRLATVQRAVLDRVAEYESAGIKRDDALARAVEDVSKDLGTTKETILGQIGAPGTVDAQGNKVQATGVYRALETGLADVQRAVLGKVAEYEAAGIKRDDALSRAITDVSTDLGVAKETILGQIGAPASVDSQGQPVAATGVYKALETGLADVQKAVLDKVATYEAAGIKRDEALGLAVDDVATDLRIAKETILGQIGAPASVDAQGKPVAATGVYKALETATADLQTKYDSLTAGQKALAGQLQQQGLDLKSAIEQAQQQTQTQIAGLSQELQSKFNVLTDEQKALAGQLSQQGIDFRTAIDVAATQTATGFQTIAQQIATNQAQTQQKIADEAAATRAANAAAALRTQRQGNLNNMLSMLMQTPDLQGQQVTVKTPDPVKLGYMYDFGSIFANPAQQNLFASPYGVYAKGGVVRNELDDVNDELLRILRG